MKKKKNIILNDDTTNIICEDFNNIKENIDISEYVMYDRFDKARDAMLKSIRHNKGIGTLSEKTVHGMFKLFYEPDEDKHEVAVDGYFADICNENGIIEIQNGNFNKIRDKRMIFLNHYPVTVVYPLPYNKRLSLIDKDTMSIIKRRKSPKHYSEYDAFYELYKIKDMLSAPNLSIQLVLMDVEEYRLFMGRNSRGRDESQRYDRIPVGIRSIISIEQVEDYMQFVPYELESGFTSADFADVCGISRQSAGMVLNILNSTGTVIRTGKRKNMYIYDVKN